MNAKPPPEYGHDDFTGRWRLPKTKDGKTTFENVKTGERRELPEKGRYLIGPDGKTRVRQG